MQQKTYGNTSSLLLDAIKAGKEEVLKQFYHTEYPKTEKYVVENGGTSEQAKDIFQEAFIALWRNVQLDKVHTDNEAQLAGYLYKIAKYKWIDYLRSAHHQNRVLVDDFKEWDTADEPPPEQHQHLEAIKTAFRQLSENCREVLHRFYYKNEPVQAIAEKMNWTEATVRNNKYRCMERLRHLLKKK